MIHCKYRRNDKCNVELLAKEFMVHDYNSNCIGEAECGYYEEWLECKIEADKNILKSPALDIENRKPSKCEINEEYVSNIKIESGVLPILSKNDKEMVQHPNHYNSGKYEVIDVIDDWKLGFYEGNIVKYVARAKHKGNEIQDLKKAKFYLDRLIELVEGER